MTRLLFIFFLFIYSVFSNAQNKISGFVKDVETGELLIGATIVECNSTNGTATNSNGYFSILSTAKEINVSYIGYQPQKIICKSDTLITISLQPGEQLGEVVISGQGFKKFNTTILSVKQLKSIPAIGGKPDVLKTLQLMPGIQSQGEGTSLLNVRGGNPGENLYLIDNIPLLYVNHLGGFMSVFNPDMINAIEVYKGGFPSRYGGKLSSVMAITQREGNNKQWKGNFGLGLTDASFSFEGPLIKDKASIIVTGRKTLLEPIMLIMSRNSFTDYLTFYGFHDINAKISFRPNTKNSFHINLYQGDDYSRFWTDPKAKLNENGKLLNIWGNWMLAGRWSRVVSPRLFVNNMLSSSNYRLKINQEYTYNAQTDSTSYHSMYLSSVKNLSFSSDWHYKVSMNYNLDFGVKLCVYDHIPNKISQSDQPEHFYEQIKSYENAMYLSNQFKFLNIIDADIGLRAISFINNNYSSFKLEPRIVLNVTIATKHTLNFSYQNINQFAHLLFTSGAILNNEIWVPADKKLAPSNSEQFSLGWKVNFSNEMFDVELNVYHKTLNNLATYKEGYSNLLGDGAWRNKIETGGYGKSQGIEVLFNKNKGNWTGFIAYTLSKTTRQFDAINRGQEFVFDYDRPHAASLNINRILSDKWSASISWVYQTGLPYTPVIARHNYPDGKWGYMETLIYGERNSGRMLDYHRLDLGFTRKTITRKGRKAEWSFSVYNSYNRRNATAYYYGTETESVKNYDWKGNYKNFKLYKVSFFPIIPTVSYKIYFE